VVLKMLKFLNRGSVQITFGKNAAITGNDSGICFSRSVAKNS
jgi:hypothetical protein